MKKIIHQATIKTAKNILPRSVLTQLKNRFPRLAHLILHYGEHDIHSHLLEQHRIHSQVTEMQRESQAKLRVFSPYPPTRNGIADYSNNLTKALQLLIDVEKTVTFIDRKNVPDKSDRLTSCFSPRAYQEKPKNLFMLGNGKHHWLTFEKIMEMPGWILVHDCYIPDIILSRYEDQNIMELSYQEKTLSFYSRIPLHTKGLFFHSEFAKRVVEDQLTIEQKSRFKLHVLRSGHPVPQTVFVKKERIERRIIGTFGFQVMNKDPISTYFLMSRVCEKLDADGLIVGEIDNNLKRMALKFWNQVNQNKRELVFIENASDSDFDELIAKVDLAIQLRKFTNGESSGPVSKLLGSLIPCVVTDIDSFSELDCPLLYKVPPASSHVSLHQYIDSICEFYNGIGAGEIQAQEEWNANRSFDSLARELIFEMELNS